jgi:hypothetical protein
MVGACWSVSVWESCGRVFSSGKLTAGVCLPILPACRSVKLDRSSRIRSRMLETTAANHGSHVNQGKFVRPRLDGNAVLEPSHGN